jgi:hypothetical protein
MRPNFIRWFQDGSKHGTCLDLFGLYPVGSVFPLALMFSLCSQLLATRTFAHRAFCARLIASRAFLDSSCLPRLAVV